MSFILSTDTSCDIKKSELAARNIKYVPLSYIIEGVTYYDNMDSDAEYKEFFTKLRSGVMAATSQITIFEHEQYFTELLENNEGDLLHVTLSSGLSSTYASAVKAAENLAAKFPDRAIYILDSRSATMVHRLVVDDCANMREKGLSAKEVFERENEAIDYLNVSFMTYDLMHLKRGGRLSGPAAYIGSALKIKPMLTINLMGGLSITDKVHGVPKAMKLMIDRLKQNVADEPQTLYVGTADSENAQEFCEMVQQCCPQNKVELCWFGPVIGAHVGAGALALTYRGKVKRIDGKTASGE